MNLTAGLRKSASFRADSTAIIAGGARFSHGEMRDRIARLASSLRKLGIRANDRVAILAANGSPYVECYFAVLWAGGIAVPMNSRFSLPEMIEQARDAEPSILICDDAFLETALQIPEACPSIAAVIAVAPRQRGLPKVYDYETLIAENEGCDDALRSGDDIACLFYTGGTTGKAKGVMLSHRNGAAQHKDPPGRGCKRPPCYAAGTHSGRASMRQCHRGHRGHRGHATTQAMPQSLRAAAPA